jgi:hypothetical protein
MKLAKAALLLTLSSAAAWAQVNAGEQQPEPAVPFNLTTVATFELPWRIAFLPDGRMLITEKVGPVWLVTQQGDKTLVAGTPPVYWEGQNGMLGVFISPHFATDETIYLTYAEPGDTAADSHSPAPNCIPPPSPPASATSPSFGVSSPAAKAARKARRSPSPPMASLSSSPWATASASPPLRIPTSPKARSCT